MMSLRFPFRLRMFFTALPFFVALAVYIPSLQNGFAMIDDGLLIYENNLVRSISPHTLWIAFTSYDPELYIPLTFISYQFDYFIGGYHPFIYHFTSAVLHAGSALLVVSFITSLTGRKHAAILCGILFAVHPLHTEAVAWAAARKDILSSFLFLASLVTYRQSLANEKSVSTRHSAYIGSILLFLFALLAKVSVISLPLILVALHFFQADLPWKRIMARVLPFFTLSFVFGIVALGGKSALILGKTTGELFLLACKTTVFAFFKILYPFHASVFYPELQPITLQTTAFFLSPLFLIAIGLLVWRFRAKKEFLFGAFFFFITLAPSFLAVNKGGNTFFFSDRYAYLPSIGILLIAVSFVHYVKISKHQRVAFFTVLISVFALFTIHQSLLWGNSAKLFSQAVAAYPDFYLAHIDLGAALREERKLDEALQEFRTAISLHALPNTYGLIGQIEAERGNFSSAIKEFESGLQLLPTDPELLYGLAQVYGLAGESAKAMRTYEEALVATKDETSAYRLFARRISARRDMIFLRMGILVGEQGHHDEAIKFYERALLENPYNVEAHYNLAVGLGNLERMEEAMSHYEQAIRLDPHHIQALTNLGILYERSARRLDALRAFRTVLEIDPNNSMVRAILQSLGME